MICEIQFGDRKIRGASVGGMYTSLEVGDLSVQLDAGFPLQSSAPNLFLSHAHLDHIGALIVVVGMRELLGLPPVNLYCEYRTADSIRASLSQWESINRRPIPVNVIPMRDQEEIQIRRDLWVKAIRSLHGVPSLAYLFFRKTQRLREEFKSLPGHVIGRLKREGRVEMFDEHRVGELAYVTDSKFRVFSRSPELTQVKTLITECTYLDAQRSVEDARRNGHMHIEEFRANWELFDGVDNIVMMHFSYAYMYNPKLVPLILSNDRVHPLC